MEKTRVYAHDKPGDCANCRYHDWNRDKCYLGKNNCYYLTEIEPEEESECDDCPYRSEEPCLGYCMKKCYAEMRGKWRYDDE